jgi:Flp pilus assembly protein TadG
MGMMQIRKRSKSEKGQSLVEFALVVPLLLLLVIGIAEFGRAWMTKNIMTGAAREAVRVAVVTKSTDNWKAVGEARGNNVLASANIPPSTIVTEIIEADGHKTNVATVTHVHNLLFIGNLVPGIPNTITLSTSTTMRREQD